MSKFKKTSFNDRWLLDPSLSSWLKRIESDKFSAYCSLCRNSFSLSNMGKVAVSSHLSGKKHKLALQNQHGSLKIKEFFTPKNAASGCVTNTINEAPPSENNIVLESCSTVETTDSNAQINSPSSSAKVIMNKFIQSECTLKSEIIWSIDTVMQHRSIRSAERSAELFKIMFPDSETAKLFQLGRTKIGYQLLYGIAPYFQNLLKTILNQANHVVVGFDESLNKVSQKGQMDISVRFCGNDNIVQSRYFNSTFLGHSKAEDLLSSFCKGTDGIDHKKILQVSMDGPNVNTKFIKIFQESLNESEGAKTLITIGSCGLHTTNNAFKSGINATDWGLIEFLRAIYNLFHNVPSRRADYTHYSDSTTFPKKYCSIRWLENSHVAKTAATILPNLIAYVEGVEKDKKDPKCRSFITVKTMLKDKMLAVKLAFFQSLAEELEPFLRAFQSDEPLAPFLYESLTMLLHNIMQRIVKKEVLTQHMNNVTKIDLNKVENLKSCKEVDLGYGTRQSLRNSGKHSDLEVLQFRKDCRSAMVAVCSKLLEKSPLKSKMTKGISVLSPDVTLNANLRDSRLKIVLQTFVENGWIPGSSADKIDRQFNELCTKLPVINLLKSFDRKQQRLDKLWLLHISQSVNGLSEELCEFFKMILILSHGNASLERGFSINKECIVENQSEESLIAQRVIFDSVMCAGGTRCIDITKSMLQYVKNARSRYGEALDKKRAEKTEEEEARKRKMTASKQIKELAAKKLKILEEAQRSIEEIEEQLTSLRN